MSPLPPTRERPATMVTPPYGAAVPRPGEPQPRPGHRRMLKLALFATAILFAVLLGAVVSSAFLVKREANRFVTPKTAAVRDAQKQLQQALPGKPANILIMGSDYRTGFDENDRRSDTMLMVRLDPKNQTVSMLSFPRDLWVDIPGHGQAKINDAFSQGGPALSVATVKELTGLDVNFIMVVDFKGFRGIVDALGGVYTDVDRRYYNDPENGGGNYAAIDIQPGYQLLGGRDALAFARYRHDDSDFHRIARQQQLLAALKKQVSTSSLASNAGGLVNVLNKNVDAATGGNGQIGTRQLVDYMRLALKLRGKDVYQVELEGEAATASNGASIVQVDDATLTGAVQAFMNPDRKAQSATADQVEGVTPQPGADGSPAVPPARIAIEVKNGNGIAGSAGAAAVELRKEGYPVTVLSGPGGNADNPNYANTRVQYRADRDAPLAEAVAARFPGATAEKWKGDNQFTGRLLVITGKNMAGAAAADPAAGPADAPESNKVPEKAPARVATDPEYGLSSFQAVVAEVGFPMMYPTVREVSSVYDTDQPARAYQIAKGRSIYKAYRIVARTGSGDYWGLQGTTWPDPPLLADPTREVTRGGRTYQLYFNGTRLHMVAWREADGVYWVSNSVLDKLSNETMLAIAQGAKRVPRA